jgi:hypothetical protein
VVIKDNIARWTGGGINMVNTDLEMKNLFVLNNAAEDGAGMAFSGMDMEMDNILVANNVSTATGAGIYFRYTDARLNNVTLVQNDAGREGIIMCVSSTHLMIENSILYNGYGKEVTFHDWYNPCELWISYTDLEGGTSGVGLNGNGVLHWLEGNIQEDPQIHQAGMYNYSLSEFSPCVDAGTPDTTGLNLPLFDILGNKRIWDGNGDGVAVVDMGAFEYGSVIVGEGGEVGLQAASYKLQAFPNPTNRISDIRYQISDVRFVLLEVYDVHGQKIGVLLNEKQAQGDHVYRFDGSELPAGIYLIRVQAGNQTTSTKLVITH